MIKLNILNVTTSDLVFTAQANDFSSKDETGTPEVLLDGSLPATSSLRSWVAPIASVRLKPKQSQTIDVKISVPANAEPGGHYGVVRFSGTPPELVDTGVALSASTGTLVLVRVNGAVNEQLQLADFFVSQGGTKSWWFEAAPITLVQRIKNTGNVHVKPIGDATITDSFGRQVATIPLNEEKRNVLPNSIRRFEEKFDKSWLFGQYTVSMALAYGTTGQVLEGKLSFWVIPWKLILLALAILIIIIFGARWLLGRYKNKIISQSRPNTHFTRR